MAAAAIKIASAAQGDNAVWQTGVDQRLRPNDGAGAAGTIYDDGCVGIRCKIVHPIHQLGVWHADTLWDAHAVELGRYPAV